MKDLDILTITAAATEIASASNAAQIVATVPWQISQERVMITSSAMIRTLRMTQESTGNISSVCASGIAADRCACHLEAVNKHGGRSTVTKKLCPKLSAVEYVDSSTPEGQVQ